MRSWIFATLLLIPCARLAAQNVGINGNGAVPNPTALLDIDASSLPIKRGLLIPRMTTVERNGIAGPATSLLIFNTTTAQFEYFDGTIWRPLLSSSIGWTTLGNAGTVSATNFIGTTDNVALTFRTNNQFAGRLDHINSNAMYGTLAGLGVISQFNTLIGMQAGGNTTSGGANTFIGAGAGFLNNTGPKNTAVGFQATTGVSTTNSTAIGANASAPNDNTVVIGSIAGVNTAVSTVNVGIGTNDPVERLDVAGTTRTTNLQMTAGAGTGFLLTGDVAGNAIWANPTAALVNAWGLGGNTGTDPLTQFVGTADNQPLVFRTNNQPAGRLDHLSGNTFFGSLTGPTTSGIFNTFLGAQAGSTTTTGAGNTFLGGGAGFSNNNGQFNTAVGFQAITGASLVNATAIGTQASVTQSNSMVLGSIAGVNTATSSTLVGIGTTAPAEELHVVGNIRMVDGNQAASRVMVSDANGTATWQTLGPATTNAWQLTGNAGTNPATNFLGTTDAQPLRLRAGNAFAGQLSNTATGVVSYGLGAGAVNTGASNTFIGSSAGAANVASGNNTYVGTSAGAANATGQQNVYLGRLAGGNGNAGSDNVLIGNAAGLTNTANNNVMIGSFAGNGATTGGGNTYLGTQSGAATSTGGQNTFLGTGAGSSNTIGSQNTLIGNGASVNANNLTNAAAIGRASRVDASDAMVLGSVNGINGATSTTNVGIGTTFPGARLHVRFDPPSANINSMLRLEVTQATSFSNIGFSNSASAAFLSMGMSNTGEFGIATAANFGAGITELMRIRTNGNVGFGTAAPLDRLHVVGNIRMVDGNQAAGRVLVSDVNGTGTWQTLGTANTNAWGLTGNAGTTPATNFIGTTDAQDLVFRVGNAFAGQVSNTTTEMLALGLGAGALNTGTNNTFLGNGAGAANTNTVSNTYVGNGAGQFNATGGNNVYVGRFAGRNGTSGSDNILIGNGAGIDNLANRNVMIGSFAGNSNTSGSANICVGMQAGQFITTASQNTLVGNLAGSSSTGAGNTFIGNAVGGVNTTGTENTLLGLLADVGAAGLTNASAIGSHSQVDASNSLVLGGITGVNGGTDVNVGIGTTTPARALHVSRGASGGTSNAGAEVVVEDNTAAYQHFLSPSTTENGLLFGNEIGGIRSAMIFNGGTTDGFDFRTGGNTVRMTIDNVGQVGIGPASFTDPLTRLEVDGGLTIRRPADIAVVAGNNNVTVGDRSYLRISSATTANFPVVLLSNGLVIGQILVLECSATGAFGWVLADAGTVNLTVNHQFQDDDTVTLIWNGTDWLEINFSDN